MKNHLFPFLRFVTNRFSLGCAVCNKPVFARVWGSVKTLQTAKNYLSGFLTNHCFLGGKKKIYGRCTNHVLFLGLFVKNQIFFLTWFVTKVVCFSKIFRPKIFKNHFVFRKNHYINSQQVCNKPLPVFNFSGLCTAKNGAQTVNLSQTTC